MAEKRNGAGGRAGGLFVLRRSKPESTGHSEFDGPLEQVDRIPIGDQRFVRPDVLVIAYVLDIAIGSIRR